MSSTAHPLPFGGDLTLRAIRELQLRLREIVTGARSVTLDTATVENIDIAGLQLLVSASHFASASGGAFAVTAPADGPVARILHDAGFLGTDGTALVPSISSWSITSGAA